MDPFSTSVWVAILLSAVAMSLIFFLLGRFSPGEWGNPFPCVDEPNRCGKRGSRITEPRLIEPRMIEPRMIEPRYD